MSQNADAQNLQLPRTSPPVKTMATIGLTKVKIEYGSPRVNKREIWGKLVPYGLTKFNFGGGNPAPWRAGANENTTVYFSHDVQINGKDLKAGKYGLHMLVNENSNWEIIFSNDNMAWGSYFYDKSHDALRVEATPEKAPFREWLTYGFDNFTKDSADVFLHWENVKVSFNVKTDTEKYVEQSIKDQLTSSLGFSWQAFNQAAIYYYRQGKDLEQALAWARKSVAMNANIGNSNMLGYFLQRMGKNDEAEKVFRDNIEKFSNDPNGWNTYDSLAEHLAKTGKKKEAAKYYKMALKKAPQQQKDRIKKALADLKK
jgi:tetratricopeptide (TPR) repeat protein